MVILNQSVKSLAFFDNPQAGAALKRLFVNFWWNTSGSRYAQLRPRMFSSPYAPPPRGRRRGLAAIHGLGASRLPHPPCPGVFGIARPGGAGDAVIAGDSICGLLDTTTATRNTDTLMS